MLVVKPLKSMIWGLRINGTIFSGISGLRHYDTSKCLLHLFFTHARMREKGGKRPPEVSKCRSAFSKMISFLISAGSKYPSVLAG